MCSQLLLPPSLLGVLEREAGRRGVPPEVVAVEMLLRLAREEERPRVLLDAARTALEHADRWAERGEYLEALWRLWGSVVLLLEAYAESVGLRVEGLGGFYSAASRAAGEGLGVLADAWSYGVAARVLRELGDKGAAEGFYGLARSRVGEAAGALAGRLG